MGFLLLPVDTLGCSHSLLHLRLLVRVRTEGTWKVEVSSHVPSCPGVMVTLSCWHLPWDNPNPVHVSGPRRLLSAGSEF